jgi:hypothetical protein
MDPGQNRWQSSFDSLSIFNGHPTFQISSGRAWEGEAPAEPQPSRSARLGRSLALPEPSGKVDTSGLVVLK